MYVFKHTQDHQTTELNVTKMKTKLSLTLFNMYYNQKPCPSWSILSQQWPVITNLFDRSSKKITENLMDIMSNSTTVYTSHIIEDI